MFIHNTTNGHECRNTYGTSRNVSATIGLRCRPYIQSCTNQQNISDNIKPSWRFVMIPKLPCFILNHHSVSEVSTVFLQITTTLHKQWRIKTLPWLESCICNCGWHFEWNYNIKPFSSSSRDTEIFSVTWYTN